MNTKSKSSVGKAVGVGAGVLALAAAAYLLAGPNGKKNQKQAKAWMLKMKGEVVKKLKALEHVTEPMYHKIVDSAAALYAAKGGDPKEVKDFIMMMKKEWKNISKVGKKGKSVAKKAVKVAKKSVKSKKVAKK